MSIRGSRFTALVLLAAALALSACSNGEISTAITAGPPIRNAALAVVPKQGRKYWALAIAETPSDARKSALASCGNPFCTVVEEFTSGECVVVIQGDTQVFWGKEPKVTTDEVLDYCNLQTRNCQIARHECLK
jgi:hypothetical protein